MEKIKDIKNFVLNIIKIIKLIFETAPFLVTKLVFCNVMLGIVVSVNVYLWKQLVDSVTQSLIIGDIKFSIFWLLCIGLCTGVTNFLTRLGIYYREIAQEYVNRNITEKLMGKIDELNMECFDDPEMYDTIEKVSNESVARCMCILIMLVSLVQYFTTFIGVVTVIVSLNKSVALVACLVMIPIFYVSINIAYKQYKIYVSRVQKMRMVDYLIGLCLEYDNIKELKIYNALSYLKKKILNIYNEYIEEDKNYKRKFLIEFTLTDFGHTVCSFGVRIFILYESFLKKKTIGDFTMYISALDNMENSINSLMDAISSLYTDNLYIESLLLLLNMESTLKDGKREFLVDKFSTIEFRDVWFRYPNSENYVLKGISLKLERGKVYALLGLNGSGKTTLVKLLMRLYDPEKGNIFLDGVDIKEYSLQSLYRNIGVVFQDFVKYPLTVNENVGIGNIAYMGNMEYIKKAIAIAGADKFIQNLPRGYQTILEKEWDEGSELSGGQWQKIAIARACLKKASILVLDEPSAALDPEAEFEIFQKMKVLMKGKMSILITHRFSNTDIVDYIFMMEEGKVIECGTHQDLMKAKNKYYSLYKLQAEAYNDSM